jgi:hypothetical protein
MTANISYSFSFAGGTFNEFRFITDDSVQYSIKFVPSTDFFPKHEVLDVAIYELIIIVEDNPLDGRLRADPRVSPTIFSVFIAFYTSNRQAFIYICDSSNGRAAVRHRKFDSWFSSRRTEFGDSQIDKIDRVIETNDELIFLSLMMSRLHPNYSRVVDVFMRLGEEGKENERT